MQNDNINQRKRGS